MARLSAHRLRDDCDDGISSQQRTSAAFDMLSFAFILLMIYYFHDGFLTVKGFSPPQALLAFRSTAPRFCFGRSSDSRSLPYTADAANTAYWPAFKSRFQSFICFALYCQVSRLLAARLYIYFGEEAIISIDAARRLFSAMPRRAMGITPIY